MAVITFPASLLRPTMAIRWQHFADILLSVEAVLGERYVHVSGQKANITLSRIEIHGYAILCMWLVFERFPSYHRDCAWCRRGQGDGWDANGLSRNSGLSPCAQAGLNEYTSIFSSSVHDCKRLYLGSYSFCIFVIQSACQQPWTRSETFTATFCMNIGCNPYLSIHI